MGGAILGARRGGGHQVRLVLGRKPNERIAIK
jgi:hypothetical protein